MPWTNTKPNGDDARCAVCGLSGMYDGYGRQPGVPKAYDVLGEVSGQAVRIRQAFIHNTCVADWLQAHPQYALQLA